MLVHADVVKIDALKEGQLGEILGEKVGCKATEKRGQMWLYHPTNLPNDFFLGRGILVFKDKASNYYDVFSLGPYGEPKKKGDSSFFTQVAHSQFLEAPFDMFQSKQFLISL